MAGMNDQISLFGRSWQYFEDSGNMMAECPECTKRMPIYPWTYNNYYRYCPYCGTQLSEGKIKEAGRRIYHWQD